MRRGLRAAPDVTSRVHADARTDARAGRQTFHHDDSARASSCSPLFDSGSPPRIGQRRHEPSSRRHLPLHHSQLRRRRPRRQLDRHPVAGRRPGLRHERHPGGGGGGARRHPEADRSSRALGGELALALGSLVRDRGLSAGVPRRSDRRAREDARDDDGAGARVQPAGARDAAAELPADPRAARRGQPVAQGAARRGPLLSRAEVARAPHLPERRPFRIA